MSRATRTYSDLDFAFSRAANNDLAVKYDENAIKQSVRNLVLTANYERPFHPEIGCQAHGLLFENFTPITEQIVRQTVYDVLTKFEGRIYVLDIKTNALQDDNQLQVSVTFRFRNDPNPITVNTFLSRVR
jgi:phage baseplate assembly protein W